MKKRAQSRPDKDLTRLKERLSICERQLKSAVNALKHTVHFRSAQVSVFATEVQELQRVALTALCEVEELQRGKSGRVLSEPHTRSQINQKALQRSLEKRQGKFLPESVEDP